MKNKSTGLRVGIALAAIHLCMVILAYVAMVNSHSSTAGLVFVWFTFLDAPVVFVPHEVFNAFGIAAPLVQFGVLGSALWFFIPWVIDKAALLVFSKDGLAVRGAIIAVSAVLILIGFSRLSFIAVKHSIQRERPAELKEMLNSASSDFLTGKVIFAGKDHQENVLSITRMNCRTGQGAEILLATPWSVVFLNDGYQEQYRFKFPVHYGFKSAEPLLMDGMNSCGLLAHRIFEKAYLFDTAGKELWNSGQPDNSAIPLDGAQYGDIDGDGKPEFVLYRSYSKGIELVGGGGKTRWIHPVFSLGHVEIANINADGKAAIIYSNSNNANGSTEFTTLDSEGRVADILKVATMSYEFAAIKWPDTKARPNLLLTEEDKIRLVDWKGDTVIQLDAPGSRAFGNFKAITVKFKIDEPEFLAVKKSLHPDISVLYVYDGNGKLVYQKNQVIEGLLTPTLTAVPDNANGAEKLLVGEYAGKHKSQVLEYSITKSGGPASQ